MAIIITIISFLLQKQIKRVLKITNTQTGKENIVKY
jgi:hypothetical protein